MKKILTALAAALLFAVSITSATATNPPRVVTFDHSSECGTASVTVTGSGIGATWYYGAKIAVDGVEVDSVLIQGPGTDTAVLNFTEDQGDGTVTVRYWIHASTEWDAVPADLNYQSTWPDVNGKFREFTVDTDCEPPIVVDPPVVVPPDTAPEVPPAAPAATPVVERPRVTG